MPPEFLRQTLVTGIAPTADLPALHVLPLASMNQVEKPVSPSVSIAPIYAPLATQSPQEKAPWQQQ